MSTMQKKMESGDRRSSSSGLRARDMSPDSVIHTAQSNFIRFSSTSGSGEASNRSTGKECCKASSGGQDLDPKKVINMLGHKSDVSKKEKVKVRKSSGDEAETEDEMLYLGTGKTLFSQALKECQDHRSRSEVLFKKKEKRRPDSLVLNNTVTNAASSPRLAVMKKASVMASQTGMFPSPGTPNYRHASVGVQKGWSSERVPLHTNANRRHMNTTLLPYSNGKALPSKWEDAERWILSPVMGDCNQISSSQKQQLHKPKSKSGPLGPPGVAYYSMYSPAVPMLEGGSAGNVIPNSPFSAGVMEADGMSTRHSTNARVGNLFMPPEACIARSVSLHGYTELISQSLLPGPQDVGKVNDTRDAASDVSRPASRRDMATQMSPEGSPLTSPGRPSSCSASTPSILPVVELPNSRLSRSDIRDVQVDEGVTVTRWSKKNKPRILAKGSGNDDDWKKKAIELRSSSWENSESSISISKVKREEARIIAWENLQKAKAEAAIRKLEMKLEKKRSSSMDKIINKLKSAQKKAQEMRSSVMANQSQQVSKTSNKTLSLRRTHQMVSLSGCFTCPAF
ncbi:hypothetical protein LIER_28896 [Lithospermum erythrorhizon]|uniref:Remorin C-terminal domain-containing protein n=1 Tax=Lithospermum erythrorhizon TaxID=34254 RepID=A0AAV3RLJ3_LITER